MRRREFVAATAGTLFATSLAAHAQTGATLPGIAYLGIAFPLSDQHTTQALGIALPPAILRRADEVIE